MVGQQRMVGVGLVLTAVLIGAVVESGHPAARAQEPQPAGQPPRAAAATDVATRYRFLATFTTQPPAPDKPAEVGQLRIAFRETLTSTVDTPRAAPAPSELNIQAIYQERPAELGESFTVPVRAAVRHYQKVMIKPEPKGSPATPPLFEDLTIWFEKNPPGELPLARVLVLNPGRPLRDREFQFATRQVFVPDLSAALPEVPVRLGETYRLNRTAASALLGGPAPQAELTGKLLGITADAQTGGRTAAFDLIGQGLTDRGNSSVHARLEFAVNPTPAGGDPTDLSGHVARLRLAQEIAGPSGGGGRGERLRQYLRRELILECRTEEPGAAPLEIPAVAPEPTPENSWLTYEDSAGRFSFRYPQELIFDPNNSGPDTVALFHPRPEGGDAVSLELKPLAELKDPEAVRKGLQSEWRTGQLSAVEDPNRSGWLPEAEWPDLKVYRIEASLAPSGHAARGPASPAGNRAYFDGYIVLTGRDTGLYVESTTSQDPPGPFRDQVETLIKGFRFSGTSEPSGAPPAPTSPSGAEPTPAPLPGDTAPTSAPAPLPEDPASTPTGPDELPTPAPRS